ncbi:MAG: lipopolysaccharide assembly protein LapA domain-containing protein [Candidatus Pristimantibacillus lignocellulolyticus]|uniref:Lipopolysaccharide assembly protein LapA domain-containing protein n=1 Tax=Candidatus Pristimantibacillus lignocellulolyticus TaxID=2994561 RepID=A0A9J6ZK42_9BACL|nr:MAG: lipopolysaccharide assembly protein LapA domain-containing protein [Candidatus Pristimantibacillus lignocellulolyticus]
MKSQWMLLLAFVFALVIAVFAVINVEPVEVNFFFGHTSTPLILVILFSTLFGGLTVGALGLVRVYVLQRKVKQYEKQLAGFNVDGHTDYEEVIVEDKKEAATEQEDLSK